MNTDEKSREWHLDRRVTLALIFALLINACSLAWSAATLKAEVVQHRKELDQHARLISENRQASTGILERLARMEANQAYQTRMLERMEKGIGE